MNCSTVCNGMSESDFDFFFSEFRALLPNHRFTVTEDENIVRGHGRKGRIPDIAVFGSGDIKELPSGENAPHFVILRDGTVRQLVGLADSSGFFKTSVLRSSPDYYANARGLLSCRRDNASLYCVSVILEGESPTSEQLLSAVSLVRYISLSLLRLYGKKLPLDNNHIISAADLPRGYPCCFDTALLAEICKRCPV